jgi:RNA polymerase sigma factor (sigma-70 family)
MSDKSEFHSLMAGVRAGCARAAEELFRGYEAQVRLRVRTRLRDRRLRRLFDDADVCQSVLSNFFTRARQGAYDLDGPEDLIRLLTGMARNQVAAWVRWLSARRRDFRRATDLEDATGLPTPSPTPSQLVADADLVREVRARLNEEERLVADLRGAGRTWSEIAQELGGSGDAHRIQLRRAVSRVARELELTEE